MARNEDLKKQLDFVLDKTEFSFLGQRYQGKVRDNYTVGDLRYIVASDRLSCFDVVVTTVPFKGQVLTQLASFWFERTAGIVKNHVVDVPDPNVMVVRTCQVLPVEVIVRAYLAGSAWRDYQAGKAVSGVSLPAGLRQSEKLPEPLITPSTKAEIGAHDMPISEDEILRSGIVGAKLWQQIREAALALFRGASEEVAKRGLLLVDTKYEFGLWRDELLLVDEIHTLDSSRFWKSSTYGERLESGEPPDMLDKEPTRQWLLKQGFKGDGPIPHFTADHRIEIARHYIDAYELICGLPFKAQVGDVRQRIETCLRRYVAA